MATKIAKFQRTAERIVNEYHKDIEELAEEARAIMLPYFKKHKMAYLSGNGTWYILVNGVTVDNDELPKWLRDLLYIEFGRDDLLGLWIGHIYPDS